MSTSIFWFRRDLRLEDNAGLYEALKKNEFVLPVFIFDKNILEKLDNPQDTRVSFIHQAVSDLKHILNEMGSDLHVYYGEVVDVYKKILKEQQVRAVYCNHDYEPSAIRRDQQVGALCKEQGVDFLSFKDQVIFEKDEVLSDQKKPYTVYTPYKKKWLSQLTPFYLRSYPNNLYFSNFIKVKQKDRQSLIDLKTMGFSADQSFEYPSLEVSSALLKNYAQKRDFPALPATSHMGLHLRFGTVSVRELAREGQKYSDVWLSELVWREFFMQILYHFPHVEKKSFRPDYEKIEWRESTADFEKWCQGQTGYPLVDAGMRELVATGFMHNRVRMVVASFLTKHLLMHWYKGERFFAKYLLDYDLSANNGNWQWAAGTGCDAAPYFRVFNPTAQTERFDPDLVYIKKWVPELLTDKYPKPMVEHKFARDRALKAFAKGLGKTAKTEE